MPTNPLFSSYRTGENRVTASMIAVFERIGVDVLQRVLGTALADVEDFELVRFRNQVAEQRGSIPDASISGNFRYLVEVKTEPSASANELRDQVDRHTAGLDGSHADERVFVITPDAGRPEGLSDFSKDRVPWLSFAELSRAIQAVLDDGEEPIPTEAAFLLRELKRLFEEEGLIDYADTVIVAAGKAFPAYERAHAYVCPSGRSFRVGLTHVGFYAGGEIKPLVARIRDHQPRVMFTPEAASELRNGDKAQDAILADTIDAFLGMEAEHDREGESWQVFLLSGPEDPETVRLPAPVENTTRTATGRPWAWTLSQRYTSLAALTAGPATTSELDQATRDVGAALLGPDS